MEDPFRNLERTPEQMGRALKPVERMEFAAVDVVEIRSRFGQTQDEFANMLGICVATLRNWERGRRYPLGPSRALLRIASADPELVAHVLNSRREEWHDEEFASVRARIDRWRQEREARKAEAEQDRDEAWTRLESETPEPSGRRFRMKLDSED